MVGTESGGGEVKKGEGRARSCHLLMSNGRLAFAEPPSLILALGFYLAPGWLGTLDVLALAMHNEQEWPWTLGFT